MSDEHQKAAQDLIQEVIAVDASEEAARWVLAKMAEYCVARIPLPVTREEALEATGQLIRDMPEEEWRSWRMEYDGAVARPVDIRFDGGDFQIKLLVETPAPARHISFEIPEEE